MKAFDHAIIARLQRDSESERLALSRALEFEERAAEMLFSETSREPSRSILYRSAASIALNCRDFRKAEKLITRGLGGDPPPEIADELRDLLENVYFERHLNTRGVHLADREIQLSLAGDAVGFGKIESEIFVSKLKTFESLLYRNAERRLRMPYRESAGAPKLVKKDFEVFLSTPRAASFAVSLQIGQHGEQNRLEFDTLVDDVISDVMAGLKAVEEDDPQTLKNIVHDKKYYRNFVGLARQLAPEKNRISQVGFTYQSGSGEGRVALRRLRSEISMSQYVASASGKSATRERIRITGSLKFADEITAKRPRIKVIDEQGEEHTVIVPVGMMSDIVRPLWAQQVVISGWVERKQRSSTITLDDIERA